MENNRKVKQMLLDHYEEEICFTYPRDVTKSQIFFSATVRPTDVVETLRSNNPVKLCAEKLRKECEQFKISLENT